MGTVAKRLRNLDNMMCLVEFIYNKFGSTPELKERVQEVRNRIKKIPAASERSINVANNQLLFIVQESESLMKEISPDVWRRLQIKSGEILAEMGDWATNDDIMKEMYKMTPAELLRIKKEK